MTDEKHLQIVPAAEGKKPVVRNARLRLDAGLLYMTHPDGLSIEELGADPRFAHLSTRTLERWSSEDRWVERRKEFFDAWAERAKQQIGSQLTKMRLREMNDLEAIRARAMEALMDELTAPKSLEGLIKAVLELGKREEAVTLGIANDLMPGETKVGFAAGAEHRLEDHEARALSKTILRMRRAEVRAEQEAMTPQAPKQDVIDVSSAVEEDEDVEDLDAEEEDLDAEEDLDDLL